jgi:hypothetical protein
VALAGGSLVSCRPASDRLEDSNCPDVLRAADLYTSGRPEDVARARAVVAEHGENCVSVLQEVLHKRDGNRIGAVKALLDIESVQSLAALVEILRGRTPEPKYAGAGLVVEFISKHGWPAARARSCPKLVSAAEAFLRQAPTSYRKKKGLELAEAIDLVEAFPKIQSLADDPDPEVRAAAQSTACNIARSVCRDLCDGEPIEE